MPQGGPGGRRRGSRPAGGVRHRVTDELRVSNQSGAEALVTISEPGTGVETMYSERVAAGEDRTIRIEYPGPEHWTLFVNEEQVTNAAMWPSDNPILDFSITIRPDGSIQLIDD
jgi:hypothetical protein